MERESFVFYKSFAEALLELDDLTRVKCYDAITDYALNGNEPELKGIEAAVFKLIKPQIDANNKRFENGLKGGRPKQSQTITKTKPNNNQTETKPKPNVNVNVNDNVNVNENVKDKGVDFQQVVKLYNDTCVSFPKVSKLSESRKKTIRARLKKYSVDDLKRAFEMAEKSDFLKGGNNRNWSANFDWIMNDTNLAKILDGNYKNKPGKIEIDTKFRDFLASNDVVNWD